MAENCSRISSTWKCFERKWWPWPRLRRWKWRRHRGGGKQKSTRAGVASRRWVRAVVVTLQLLASSERKGKPRLGEAIWCSRESQRVRGSRLQPHGVSVTGVTYFEEDVRPYRRQLQQTTIFAPTLVARYNIFTITFVYILYFHFLFALFFDLFTFFVLSRFFVYKQTTLFWNEVLSFLVVFMIACCNVFLFLGTLRMFLFGLLKLVLLLRCRVIHPYVQNWVKQLYLVPD